METECLINTINYEGGISGQLHACQPFIYFFSVELVSVSVMIVIIESERASIATHCCTLIDIFVYIYIYIVTKILRKIRATTFTENYGKLRVRGGGGGVSERGLQLVLVEQPFTRSLPARILSMVDTTQTFKKKKIETA